MRLGVFVVCRGFLGAIFSWLSHPFRQHERAVEADVEEKEEEDGKQAAEGEVSEGVMIPDYVVGY